MCKSWVRRVFFFFFERMDVLSLTKYDLFLGCYPLKPHKHTLCKSKMILNTKYGEQTYPLCNSTNSHVEMQLTLKYLKFSKLVNQEHEIVEEVTIISSHTQRSNNGVDSIEYEQMPDAQNTRRKNDPWADRLGQFTISSHVM